MGAVFPFSFNQQNRFPAIVINDVHCGSASSTAWTKDRHIVHLYMITVSRRRIAVSRKKRDYIVDNIRYLRSFRHSFLRLQKKVQKKVLDIPCNGFDKIKIKSKS